MYYIWWKFWILTVWWVHMLSFCGKVFNILENFKSNNILWNMHCVLPVVAKSMDGCEDHDHHDHHDRNDHVHVHDHVHGYDHHHHHPSRHQVVVSSTMGLFVGHPHQLAMLPRSLAHISRWHFPPEIWLLNVLILSSSEMLHQTLIQKVFGELFRTASHAVEAGSRFVRESLEIIYKLH